MRLYHLNCNLIIIIAIISITIVINSHAVTMIPSYFDHLMFVDLLISNDSFFHRFPSPLHLDLLRLHSLPIQNGLGRFNTYLDLFGLIFFPCLIFQWSIFRDRFQFCFSVSCFEKEKKIFD